LVLAPKARHRQRPFALRCGAKRIAG
jgi:hypothetical protein